MDPWPLVGRAEELNVLLEVLRGGERGVVIAGALGVGKTRLAREVAAGLESEMVVEWAAATPASASIPFGALAHLLPDVAAAPDDRLRLLRSITAAVEARAGGRPLVLAVD